MNNITICIPTYKRREMLSNLIISILNCTIDKTRINNITLIIVDNDPERSAETTVLGLQDNCNIFTLKYFSYPVKGLANVRNELLRIAFTLYPDFIVFIDDDEFVSPDWLEELVGTIILNNCDMVMGPVVSIFDETVPISISRWIERPVHDNNSRMNFIRTGNLIIRARTLLEYNVWFDKRFNMTGGEDSYFGLKMISKGAVIYWAANAVAFETVPAGRANLPWLLRRYYNGANIFTRILRMERKYIKFLKKVVVSMLYLFVGGFSCIIILFPGDIRYWGILKIAEGLGGLAGSFNIKYHEYK
jgi:succinoglycan biosynthesis protein ExoM